MPCFWLNSPEQLPLPGLLAMRNVRYAQPSITRSRAVSLNITLAACALASETWSDLGDTNGIPTVPIGMCQNCRKWCFVIIKDIGVHHGSPTIFPSNSWTCLFIRIWLLTLECFWYCWLMGFPARIIPDVSWRKWGQPQIPNGGHTYSSYSIVSYYIPLDPITMHVSLIMYNIVYTYVYIYIIYIYPIASHIYIYPLSISPCDHRRRRGTAEILGPGILGIGDVDQWCKWYQ
jgi:hypothetical protein